MSTRAGFTRMDASTKEDWNLIVPEFIKMAHALPDRVLAHLKLLEGDYGGFPVDRYTHSLQTATLALKDGRDEEYVACALLHDIGDTLGSFNHLDIAAAILRPRAHINAFARFAATSACSGSGSRELLDADALREITPRRVSGDAAAGHRMAPAFGSAGLAAYLPCSA